MSAKAETVFTTRVNKALKGVVYFEKMHNPYRGGTPDFWYSGPSGDLWIEYKYIAKLPVKAPIDCGISELQRTWINARYAEGRAVWVVVGHPDGARILTHGAWNIARDNAQFKEYSVSVADLQKCILRQVNGKQPNNAPP